MKFTDVKFIQQTTKWTCSHTCIAMLIGSTELEVVQYCVAEGIITGLNNHRFEALLSINGVIFKRVSAPKKHGWYSVQVPSLNVKGGFHRVIFYFGKNRSVIVYDPTCGNKKYSLDGSNLWGKWVNLIQITSRLQ